ncbi:hypothetical protein [Acuticoccus mangrovi]|uniref:Sulfotransferase domain-containing protein n=1 Tax=Acuticoccus mangrovi TaxID=2796142 RepID=A0A934MGL6_9HYPH|nr:hypothetical protein [Acuticoccus mangrovi]MBJ3775121.1 hypothetical protein [Acuticoccus mangrovi]
MLEHLTLHIGHPKTGTSSIQATFQQNAAVLGTAGVYYFDKNRNHHPIGRVFHGGSPTNPGRDKFDRGMWDLFWKEIEATKHPRALVTSEVFIRLTPAETKECIAKFHTVAKEVDVLLYVRHPISYASSAACQGVRSGKALAVSIAEPRVLPFRELIRRWSDAAGEDHFKVRPFDRAQMANGDVIDDILDTMGLLDLASRLKKVRSNEGLSVMGIHLLDRALNMYAPGRMLPLDSLRPFDAVGGPKYVLPEEALEKVREQSAPELAFLKEKYGIVLPEPRDVPSPPPNLDEETMNSLADVLFRMAQYTFDVDRSVPGRLLEMRSPFTARSDVEPHPLAPWFRRLGIWQSQRIGQSIIAGRYAKKAGKQG